MSPPGGSARVPIGGAYTFTKHHSFVSIPGTNRIEAHEPAAATPILDFLALVR
jgi:hypothetical protein